MSPNLENRRRSRARLPIWGLLLLVLLLGGFLIGSGVWLFQTVQAFASEWEATGAPEFAVAEPANVAVEESPIVVSSNSADTAPSETEETAASAPLPQWEGTERVTILLMGVDHRCGEVGPTRTDTLMLLTADPLSKSAGILSLPRDLWVEIPGFEVNRINQAHYIGQAVEYPGGGPALAVKTVETMLGVKIDHYATVNFTSFAQLVDMLGGIEIDVPEAIFDEKYPDLCYGFDPFTVEAGLQTLSGPDALKYARTRATEGGDVDRAARQQAVVLAVRDKVFEQIPELIIQAPQLWQTLQENVRTTMTLDEALQLALLVQEIPRENIRRAVIDYNDVYLEKNADGDDVLVPIRENVRALRDELFTPPKSLPIPLEELPERFAAEDARVAVLNGTEVFGLAGDTQTYLNSLDVNVTEIGNADSTAYAATQIIDFGENPATTQYLVQLFSVSQTNVSNGNQPEGDYDVLVILGNDWRVPGQ